MASIGHYPPLEVSPEWPQQVLDEPDPVADPNWVNPHVITIGPRYGPDDSAAKIAADYIVGIQELIRKGGLQETPVS